MLGASVSRVCGALIVAMFVGHANECSVMVKAVTDERLFVRTSVRFAVVHRGINRVWIITESGRFATSVHA